MFFEIVIVILTLVANWMVYKKMGLEGWESIVPFYNAYVLFRELYGNGWKFLLLFVPIYNIYVAVKLDIDLAKAFNQSTGFGLGLFFINFVFITLLGFKKEYVYGDGSKANNEDDFVSNTVEAIGASGAEFYENAKEKYQEAGGAEGIAEDIKEKARDFAEDAKEKAKDLADDAKERFGRDNNASGDGVETLRRLSELRDQGILTEEEFTAKKEEILKKL